MAHTSGLIGAADEPPDCVLAGPRFFKAKPINDASFVAGEPCAEHPSVDFTAFKGDGLDGFKQPGAFSLQLAIVAGVRSGFFDHALEGGGGWKQRMPSIEEGA